MVGHYTFIRSYTILVQNMDVTRGLLMFTIFGLALVVTPVAATPADDEARIAAARAIPRDEAALSEALRGTGTLPRVARTTPLDVQVGDVETFWVSDPATGQNRRISAELRYAGSHVLMYVDTALNPDQRAVEQSAKTFEQRIYPRNRLIFGNERAPGIDGDARLTIVNTLIRGAGGYFSPTDAVVRGANRFSNERDMFVIDLGSYPLGTDGYAATLAHEFQHMIHESRNVGGATWFDEGLATLAEDLNGYVEQGTVFSYLQDPDLPMTVWEPTGAHYGMVRLFMRYVYERHGMKPADMIVADAGNDLNVFTKLAAKTYPDITSFGDLFADWAVATLINDPQVAAGRYAYRNQPAAPPTQRVTIGTQSANVHQFGVDYLQLPNGPVTFEFDGSDTIGIANTKPAEGQFMWWSNRGDQRVMTLTRAIDLRTVQKATLSFRAWYEIERGYDYAFVTVSRDGGKTWQSLRSTSSTTEDPQGFNIGFGFTGVSGVPGGDINGQRGRWQHEQIDLTPFAGQAVQLRFWMISDAALNGPGLLIDDLRIPEIGLRDGFEQGETGWQAQGFVRISGTLPQAWEVRLVRYLANSSVKVEPLLLDAQGRGSVSLKAGERGVVVVAATTRFTGEVASYRYTVR
jgi:hypothetical protein